MEAKILKKIFKPQLYSYFLSHKKHHKTDIKYKRRKVSNGKLWASFNKMKVQHSENFKKLYFPQDMVIKPVHQQCTSACSWKYVNLAV